MRYKPDPNYPNWVCYNCGHKAQSDPHKIASLSTWHLDTCDVCGKYESVTQPRDFGYPQFPKTKKKRNNESN
jgi:hypothetical protein